MAIDHQAIVERFADAVSRLDFAAIAAAFTEDCVTEYPQSGELIRGQDNYRAILENYPAPLHPEAIDRSSLRVAATDQRWVVTPMFTVMKVEGSGTVGTATFRTRYPDGSTWWVVTMYELRGERIARTTTFFAPLFDAPEWRAPYVERIPTADAR